jgi:uncharacterized protein with TBP-like fold DUF4468
MKWIRQKIWIVAYGFSLPVAAQTVHVDSERVFYRNTVTVANTSQTELFFRAQKAIADYVTQQPALIHTDAINNEISGQGTIRLKSPYHLIKNLLYTITLSVKDGGYQYKIDSVYLQEQERGGNMKLTSSRELLKGMDVSGSASWMMEEQLNEIDMNLQKVIAMVKGEMKNFQENHSPSKLP